ncbi:hypothetical protein B0T14DRAFT_605671 [Immersiella caudata]|uniref:Uncharacterized protein n=1 Tax=Immersiella caudata TaxID=314043 RepID=A0AA39WLN5_9PEZI|nr:hypothetical protein B0T14DRAFT_605671 [Immersiella caudata]
MMSIVNKTLHKMTSSALRIPKPALVAGCMLACGVMCLGILDRSDDSDSEDQKKPKESIKDYIPHFKAAFKAAAHKEKQALVRAGSPTSKAIVVDRRAFVEDGVTIPTGNNDERDKDTPSSLKMAETTPANINSHSRVTSFGSTTSSLSSNATLTSVFSKDDSLGDSHTSEDDNTVTPFLVEDDLISSLRTVTQRFEQHTKDFHDPVKSIPIPSVQETDNKASNKYSLGAHQLTHAVEDFSIPAGSSTKDAFEGVGLNEIDINEYDWQSVVPWPENKTSKKEKRVNPRRQRQAARGTQDQANP